MSHGDDVVFPLMTRPAWPAATASAEPVFDPDGDRLVFFDLRAGGRGAVGFASAAIRSRSATRRALIFESTELLHPDADVPTAGPSRSRWTTGDAKDARINNL